MSTFELFWSIDLVVFLSIMISLFVLFVKSNGVGESVALTFLIGLMVGVVAFGMAPNIITIKKVEQSPLIQIGKINGITIGHLDYDKWVSTDTKEIYNMENSLICIEKTTDISMYNRPNEANYTLVKCNEANLYIGEM